MKSDSEKKVQILVVDDNEEATDALVRLLNALGWHATGVYSAASASEYLDSAHVDIIFMDIDMPVMNGYAFTKLLRSELHMTIPIIALTGYGLAANQQKALAAGFTASMVKPIGTKELRAIMGEHCPE